jgi:hypothetical protein
LSLKKAGVHDSIILEMVKAGQSTNVFTKIFDGISVPAQKRVG